MIKNLVGRPIVFAYVLLVAAVAGLLCFSQFSSVAEAPGELAAWDIPPTGSTKTLHMYGMDGPMDYRFWPYQFDPASYSPSQAAKIYRSRQTHVTQVQRLAQVHRSIASPGTLTIGKIAMAVMCYVRGDDIRCRKSA
jgi:hypothetical protein